MTATAEHEGRQARRSLTATEPALPEPSRRIVLLVEDSPGDANLATTALTEPDSGYDVLTVSSLAAARDALRLQPVDCVVADLGLPDAEGLEVIEGMRDAVASMPPVIVLTGRDDDALGLAAIRSGADDYLLKTDLVGRHLQLSVAHAIERAALRLQQQMLAAIVTSSADAIVMLSPGGVILTWNEGAEELFGYKADEAIGQHVSLLHPPGGDDKGYLLPTVTGGEAIRGVDAARRRRDGSHVPVSLTLSPIVGPDGSVTAISKIARDISHHKQLEDELKRQSLHDELTGLPNRALLTDRLAQVLSSADRRRAPVSLLFCDVDHFKRVNDTYGHLVGDQLLVEVSKRLTASLRPNDTVARFAGDEFVIICDDTSPTEASMVATRIAVALQDPIHAEGHRLSASVSIGIASSPPLTADSETLLRSADAALYEAKRAQRGGARVFDASFDAGKSDRLLLAADLQEALKADELRLHYQPQVDLATGRLVGIEALARWEHPQRGAIPASLLVAIAEEAGFAQELDTWVLHQACEDAGWLRSRYLLPEGARVAVNRSTQTVTGVGIVEEVVRAAKASGLPLSAIELEVTETGLLSDIGEACQTLTSLRALGVSVALDDFGTGYSSLTYVRKLPVSTIKIDRSFVEHITERPDDLAISSAITDMARSLGLRTVGEGVETPEQLAVLHRLGCETGQGFLWSRALPRDELAALLSRTRRFASARRIVEGDERSTRMLRRSATDLTNAHGLHRIEQLHADGASLATIAAALNSDGYRTPDGLRWHSRSVARVIAQLVDRRRRLVASGA